MIRFVIPVVVALALAGGCKKRATPSTGSGNPPADTPPPPPPPKVEPNLPPPISFVPYDSPDGRFRVSFPWSQPSVRQRTENTPFGPVMDTAYEAGGPPNSAAVFVADWDTPQLQKVELEVVITKGRDAIIQGFRGGLVKDQRQKFGPNVIRDVTIDIPGRKGQGPAYFRYLIHGRRLYTLAILVDRGTVSEADRDKFFDSFQILK